MALFDDLLKGNLVTGLAVGVGALVIGPIVAPAITAALRPAAKAAIKAGIYAYDRGSEALAALGERAGDIVAEARSELQEEPAAPPRRHSAAHSG